MKITKILTSLSLITLSQGAFTWDQITFSVDGGASITEDHTDNVRWPNGTSVFAQTVGTGSSIIGSFTVVGNHNGLISFPAGVDTTISFEIMATGGKIDFELATLSNNPDRFYAMNFFPDADVTDISYKYTYGTAIQGHETDDPNTAGATVLVGSFIDVGNASTFSQTLLDENLNPIDTSDGDIWRTRDVGSWNMVNPSSYDANGSALRTVSETQSLALGWMREKSADGAEQYVGQVYGSLSSDDGNPLGADTEFRFTFNGNFDDSAGVDVVPEPTSILLLGLGGLSFLTRRKR